MEVVPGAEILTLLESFKMRLWDEDNMKLVGILCVSQKDMILLVGGEEVHGSRVFFPLPGDAAADATNAGPSSERDADEIGDSLKLAC